MYTSLQTPQYTQYVLIMVDPDASYPEAPQNRFILHYLQANVTKSNTDTFSTTALGGTQLVNSTPPVVAYRRPRPPTNSSAHRYIFYAFQQPSANFQIPSAYGQILNGNISRFNLTGFVQAANLGTPVAANYFYASNMTSVPPTFIAAPGAVYPGGNGLMVTSGTGVSTMASASGAMNMTNTASATGTASGSATGSATGSASTTIAIATSRALADKVIPLAGEGFGFVAAMGMLLSWFI